MAGDRALLGLAAGAGVLLVAVFAGVTAFLVRQGLPALSAASTEIPGGVSLPAYIWPLVFGTVLSAGLALSISMPFSVGAALFISHYAPRQLAAPLGYVMDLLAAVPSVVYGLWGIYFLSPHLVPLYSWLDRSLGFLPFFSGPASVTGRTILTAAIVLAIMILPISTSLCREVFLQSPRSSEEAALALGATRWETVRLVVFPHARSGMISAAMLGLGRALGETMAVALVLSATNVVTLNLISSVNPGTVAANIALTFPDASGRTVNVLIATGLVLFVVTFLVNVAARSVVRRGRMQGAR